MRSIGGQHMQAAQQKAARRHGIGALGFLAVALAAGLALLDAIPASAATLDRIRQAGKLVLGYRADARPFSFDDGSGAPDRLFDRACAKAWRTRSKPSWALPTCRSNGFRSPSMIALPRSSKARSTCCAVPIQSRWKDGRRCRFPFPSFPAASLRCSGRMRRGRCRMSLPAGRHPARSGVVRRRRSSRTRPSRSFPARPGSHGSRSG